MLKRNFSPSASLYQAALEPKPMTPLGIQDLLADDVCHLVELVRAFSDGLESFLETTLDRYVQLAPDSGLVSFKSLLATIHSKHKKLLKELQALPPETCLLDSRITKLTHVALTGMDVHYNEYSRGLVNGYILIRSRFPMLREVMPRLVSPLDMACTLEAVARRRQGLKEVIALAKSGLANHAKLEALEAELRDAGTPLQLSDKPRQMQLQTTFELADFRWLGKTKYFHHSPRRIQVVLFNDRILLMTPRNEALLVWSRVEDLRIVPLNPRETDPLGMSMILVIRDAVAMRVFSPCQADRDRWVDKLESVMNRPPLPQASNPCVFSEAEECLGIDMQVSNSTPCRVRPLMAPVMERSTTAPLKVVGSSETPSLCTEESRSSESSGSSLVNSSPFCSSMFRAGLSTRSSSTMEAVTKEGVCQFLSKPCHLLLNTERGEVWALHGVVNVEVRRLKDGTSRLCATSTRSQRTLLKMAVVAGIEVRKSSASDVEIVDQRFIAYRFLMEDVCEADELLAVLTALIQPRPSTPPTNQSIASLGEAPDPKQTRLAAVTCKLFILRNSDHTWSKAGRSLLELFQLDSQSDPAPNVRLLVRCLDSTRKIHFPLGSFRCERIAPLKILIVHLDHHHHTTTIMLQLKTKQVVESLIAWLIC